MAGNSRSNNCRTPWFVYPSDREDLTMSLAEFPCNPGTWEAFGIRGCVRYCRCSYREQEEVEI